MGILDAPAATYANPRLAAWHRKVTAEVSDTYVLILSDSTADGDTRWGRLLASKIAAQWPRQTVKYYTWTDASKTWNSPTTVQTGTGSRTINVYNGAVSGQVVGYAFNFRSNYLTGNLTPDVVLFNYGHNSPQDYFNYRGLVQQAVNEYISYAPAAAITMICQNPQASGNVDYARQQESQRANYELAAGEGWGIVDVNADFIAYGNYAADLLNPDGVHPNDSAGSPRWANLVWEHLRPKTKRAPQANAARRISRVVIPASVFTACDGSPTLDATHNGLKGWSLDASSEESIVAVCDWPSEWVNVDVDVWFYTPSASDPTLKNVRLLGQFLYLGNGRTAQGGGQSAAAFTDSGSGIVTVAASTTVRSMVLGKVFSRAGLGNKPLALKIVRKAADAADNLAQDIVVTHVVVHAMY